MSPGFVRLFYCEKESVRCGDVFRIVGKNKVKGTSIFLDEVKWLRCIANHVGEK